MNNQAFNQKIEDMLQEVDRVQGNEFRMYWSEFIHRATILLHSRLTTPESRSSSSLNSIEKDIVRNLTSVVFPAFQKWFDQTFNTLEKIIDKIPHLRKESSGQSLYTSNFFPAPNKKRTQSESPELQRKTQENNKMLSNFFSQKFDFTKEDPLLNFKDGQETIKIGSEFKNKFLSECKVTSQKMQTQPFLVYDSDYDLEEVQEQSAEESTEKRNSKHPDEVEKKNTLPKVENSSQSSQSSNMYTITIIDTIDAKSESLFGTMHSFLRTLVPKLASKPLELIKSQRSKEWFKERGLRLTASRFGLVFKRSSFNPPENLQKLIHSLLNPVKYGKIPALEYGTNNESAARDDYIKKTGNEVIETGFWIRPDLAWLGGSPDGIVVDKKTGKRGLLEIKCPYSARFMTINEYVTGKKGAYLHQVGSEVTLDKNHDYYYQMQGCMHILNMDWCDFVVRTEKDIFVERIVKNQTFVTTMVSRLSEFYCRFLLPSIASGTQRPPEIEYILISQKAYNSRFSSLI